VKSIFRSPLFGAVAGFLLAASLLFASNHVSDTWLKISGANVISVTGSARRNVLSDLAIWRASYSVEHFELLEAQRRLKEDRMKVEAFLESRQVGRYVVHPIQIDEIRGRGADQQNQVVAYRLRQSVEIQSGEVGKLTSLGTEAGELVESGVAFVPQPPEYIFTSIAEARLEMLAEATADAKARAEQMAKPGGRQIGQLRSARMGVFQITRPHSTETSWEGVNDKSTVEKTVTATVTASFLLE
jgi:uncharacterized protein